MKKLGFLLLFTFITAFTLSAVEKTDEDAQTETTTSDSIYQSMDDDQRETLLLNKLSPEQLYELEKYRSAAEHGDNGPKLSGFGIVLISLMPFFTAILIVFFVIKNKRQKEQRMFQLYEKALDAGKDLPDSFFRHPEEETKSHLLKGLIWAGVGLGISIGSIFLMGSDSPWGFGLIPFFVGVAYLISHLVEKKDQANAAKDE